MTKEDAGAPRTERRGRLDVVALLDRQDLAAHHASIDDPAGRREADDDVAQSQPHDGVDREREQDEGKGELHVAEAHECVAGPAAEEAGEEPEQTADDGRQQHGAEPDEERDARAVENPRKRVAAELVRAEQVSRCAGWLETLAEVPSTILPKIDDKLYRVLIFEFAQ